MPDCYISFDFKNNWKICLPLGHSGLKFKIEYLLLGSQAIHKGRSQNVANF